jgi:hypothetical protein
MKSWLRSVYCDNEALPLSVPYGPKTVGSDKTTGGHKMRRVPFFTAAICVVLVVVFSLARAREPREVGLNAAQGLEYRIVVLADVAAAPKAGQQPAAKAFAAFEARFNEFGRDGWEYCGYLNGATVFKRPRQ